MGNYNGEKVVGLKVANKLRSVVNARRTMRVDKVLDSYIENSHIVKIINDNGRKNCVGGALNERL